MSKLLINENPLMVLPTLAVKIGLNEAILLQQVHYWIDPRINKNYRDGKFWVYNTLNEWLTQFPFWSKSTLRRTIKNLEEKNLLLSTSRVVKGYDQTKWYSVNYDQLDCLELRPASDVQNEQVDVLNMNNSYAQFGRKHVFNMNNSPDQTEHIQKFKMNNSYNSITENSTEDTTYTIGKCNFNDFVSEYEKKFNPQGKFQSVVLDKSRKRKLKLILDKYFGFDLQRWTTFLNEIYQSDFLMGRVGTFKVHFDWLLREENIRKILEGAYQQSSNSESQGKVTSKRADKIIESLDGIERAVYLELSNIIGIAAFGTWFERTSPKAYTKKGVFEIICDSAFVKDWLSSHYDGYIRRILKSHNYEYKIIYTVNAVDNNA